MHICILTSAHTIDDVRVNNKIAETFLEHGFRVSWVGPDITSYERGYRGKEGIEYHLIPSDRGRISRLLSTSRLRRVANSISGIDVYYAPDPDSAALALRLAVRDGARVIFDIHEVFHTYMLDGWLRGRQLPFLRGIVRKQIERICSRCDLVIATCVSTLKPYARSCKNSLVIRSCAPRWFADLPPSIVCDPKREFFTLMHGKRSLARGTKIIFEALALIPQDHRQVRVIMFETSINYNAEESDQFWAYVDNLGIRSLIELRPGVPIRQMPSILSGCDAGLIAYDRRQGVDTLANRPFEYMAAGLPILAPSYGQEIAKIIEEEQCGLLVDFENPAEVASAILQLKQNPAATREMGRRAREAFEKRHNWEVEVRPLLRQIDAWSHDR